MVMVNDKDRRILSFFTESVWPSSAVPIEAATADGGKTSKLKAEAEEEESQKATAKPCRRRGLPQQNDAKQCRGLSVAIYSASAFILFEHPKAEAGRSPFQN